MIEYPKIQTVYKRDMENKGKTLLEGQWTQPEFEYLANNQWLFTEKVDGTNIRIMVGPHSVTFGGRTDAAQIPAQLLNRLNDVFLPLTGMLCSMLGDDACLYGEGYGSKIQKGGGNYRPDQDFVLFDIRVGDLWLGWHDVVDIARQLRIQAVPVIGQGTLFEAITMARCGIRSSWGNFPAEGIVARPAVDLVTRRGQRIITKIKSKDFW